MKCGYLIVSLLALMALPMASQTRIGGIAGIDPQYRMERARSGIGTGKILYYVVGADGKTRPWTEGDEAYANKVLKEYEEYKANARKAAEEKERQKQIELTTYLNKKAEELPETQRKVMQFRLEQATNGSKTYQLKVSNCYTNGTDGFPLNTNLATYWFNKAQMSQ